MYDVLSNLIFFQSCVYTDETLQYFSLASQCISPCLAWTLRRSRSHLQCRLGFTFWCTCPGEKVSALADAWQGRSLWILWPFLKTAGFATHRDGLFLDRGSSVDSINLVHSCWVKRPTMVWFGTPPGAGPLAPVTESQKMVKFQDFFLFWYFVNVAPFVTINNRYCFYFLWSVFQVQLCNCMRGKAPLTTGWIRN